MKNVHITHKQFSKQYLHENIGVPGSTVQEETV